MTPASRIFVVVPAFCEERLIKRTILGVPSLAESIIVVDDASTDRTAEVVRSVADPRTHLVSHSENLGVGAAIYTGYQTALELGADVMVIMAGDNQMDGADLEQVINPILSGRADYVKGNRNIHPRAKDMPIVRRLGSRLLAQFTSWAMGTRVGDSQCGYTALGRNAALSLNWKNMWARYGYPNDLLITLSQRGYRIVEVPVRPVYADESSGLRPWHFLTILSVIARGWWRERRAARRIETAYSNEQLMG